MRRTVLPLARVLSLICLWLALLAAAPASGLSEIVRVPGDYASIGEAVAQAPAHSLIEIAAGKYSEALVIERPLSLRAAGPGEVALSAPVDRPVITVQDTRAVKIEGLTILGGEYGIFITRSQDVLVRDNFVANSRLTGIKVRLGAADILDNTVVNAQSPYGMGIHVTNTMQWAPSRVAGNIVLGNARSGVYTNMTGMITIEDNVVRGNGEHGIAVTEMSHADVFGNLVEDNSLTGIQLLDMSIARICDNLVADTRSERETLNIRQGNGITVDFHSEGVLAGNRIRGSAQYGISVLLSSYAYLHENSIDSSEAQSLFSDGSEIGAAQGCEGEH